MPTADVHGTCGMARTSLVRFLVDLSWICCTSLYMHEMWRQSVSKCFIARAGIAVWKVERTTAWWAPTFHPIPSLCPHLYVVLPLPCLSFLFLRPISFFPVCFPSFPFPSHPTISIPSFYSLSRIRPYLLVQVVWKFTSNSCRFRDVWCNLIKSFSENK